MKQLLKIMVPVCYRGVLKRNFCSGPASHKWNMKHSDLSQSLTTYTHAITRHIPRSFVEGAVRMNDSHQIDFPHAVQQWENYNDVLKRLGLKVISLSADERYPDCTFVEDTAVVIGQRACITCPGHPSRKAEVAAVSQVLENLGFEIVQLDDPTASLDGGDVIFTGQEILVGETTRSNRAAAKCLQRVFPEFPVSIIPVRGPLHLRSVVTLAQEGVLVIGGSEEALKTHKALQLKAQGQYKFIQLSKDVSANVVFVNGQTIIKSESEMGSEDFKTLTSKLTVPTVVTEFSEFYKVDGCLTCCSILLRVI